MLCIGNVLTLLAPQFHDVRHRGREMAVLTISEQTTVTRIPVFFPFRRVAVVIFVKITARLPDEFVTHYILVCVYRGEVSEECYRPIGLLCAQCLVALRLEKTVVMVCHDVDIAIGTVVNPYENAQHLRPVAIAYRHAHYSHGEGDVQRIVLSCHNSIVESLYLLVKQLGEIGTPRIETVQCDSAFGILSRRIAVYESSQGRCISIELSCKDVHAAIHHIATERRAHHPVLLASSGCEG